MVQFAPPIERAQVKEHAAVASMERKQHWEHVFGTTAPRGASWFQKEPTLSLRLLDSAGLAPDS